MAPLRAALLLLALCAAHICVCHAASDDTAPADAAAATTNSTQPDCPTNAPGANQPYDLPVICDGQRSFADPGTLQLGNRTYAYFTGAGHVQVSDDLVHWRQLGKVLSSHNWPWSPDGQFWAPHPVQVAPNRFHLYFAGTHKPAGGCKSKAHPCHAIGVAVASSPEGPFTVTDAPILGGQGLYALDPYVAKLGGVWILYYGSGPYGIHSVELNAAGTALLRPGVERKLTLPAQKKVWMESLVEAAWLLERAGEFYLFHSGPRYQFMGNYTVHVARSKDARDFSKSERRVVVTGSSALHSPGHNAVAKSACGGDVLVYHVYTAADSPRLLAVSPLLWSADGWPTVAGLHPAVHNQPLCPASEASA